MTKIRSAAFFALALFLLLASFPLRADSPVIRISTDPWPPWIVGEDGDAPTGGFAVEIAREVFKRLGLKTEMRIYPYERCLRQMQNGTRDIVLATKETEERRAYMLFTDVVATDPQLFYYATDKMGGFAWNDWPDLKGYTIGGVRGFDYGRFTKAAESHGLRVEMVESDEQNIRKLLAGRVNLIILNRSTASDYLNKNPNMRGRFAAAPKIIDEASFHFGLAKKGQAASLLPRINQTLNEMRTDGTMRNILGAVD
ncbi:MAG: transporter substrate-binding domain-containing protein [Rhodospirillales bacterium]|nr:transporter substrate-binding domain-containing protein [Rhodospirillales bacterium]